MYCIGSRQGYTVVVPAKVCTVRALPHGCSANTDGHQCGEMRAVQALLCLTWWMGELEETRQVSQGKWRCTKQKNDSTQEKHRGAHGFEEGCHEEMNAGPALVRSLASDSRHLRILRCAVSYMAAGASHVMDIEPEAASTLSSIVYA